MSEVARKFVRRRPVLSVTLDPYLANKVEEMAKAKGMSKSRVAEIALSLGVARFEELHGKDARIAHSEVAEEVKAAVSSKSKGERLADAYLRRVLFSDSQDGWTAV